MINLQSFIEAHNLDPAATARELFPDNAYPVMAMKRILQGEALLDSGQIARLAAFARVPVSKVFNNGWSIRSEGGPEKTTYTLESDEFRAEIDRSSWVTTLYHKGKAVHEEVISSPTVTISEFLRSLETVIAKQDFK